MLPGFHIHNTSVVLVTYILMFTLSRAQVSRPPLLADYLQILVDYGFQRSGIYSRRAHCTPLSGKDAQKARYLRISP